MEKRLCGHWNLARELNCSTVSYFPGKTTPVHWRVASKFSFYHLGAHPLFSPPPSKKGSFPPSLFKLWGGEGGRGRSLVLLLSQEVGFNTLNLHCSYSKAIQLSFSYCSNRCLLHIIGCLSSFLLQILSGSLHQHQPHPSSALSLSCICPGPWGMFCFQHSSCHICVLPCAEYWCKPDTWC